MESAPAPPAPPVAAGCPNCGEPAPGRYCAACGQRQDRRLASVRRMAAEGLHDQLSVGAELPRTIGALVFRPGHLTHEYLAGRVVRYIPPLRLYLVASVVFFFIVSWKSDIDRVLEEASAEVGTATDSIAAAAGPDSTRTGLQITGDGVDLPDLDTTTAGPLTPAKRWVQRRFGRLESMDRQVLLRLFMEGLQRNAPRAVFLLLPIYALVLKLLYLRRKRLYAEHFIFALHVHAFVFALFTLTFALPDSVGTFLMTVWVPLYIFLAMRRVYGQTIPKTLFKYVILFLAYGNLLLLLLIGTALITALTI